MPAYTQNVLQPPARRHPLCPLDRLAEVRERMSVANELHVVEGANHSLELTKTMLKAIGLTQDAIDDAIVRRISDFLEKLASSNHASP